MAPGKLRKFQENRSFPHLLEYTDFDESGQKPTAGTWDQRFGNDHSIILELACGRGDFAIGLAHRHPDRNFVGVDIKGARLWHGARRVLDEELENVQFLRIYIEHLADYFAADEVAEIWITFPDPFLKSRDARKRLTSPRFLSLYRRVLKPGGTVHLKTDSPELYEYTLSTLRDEPVTITQQVDDIYREIPDDPLLTLQTTYEKRHLEEGRVIRYLSFEFVE